MSHVFYEVLEKRANLVNMFNKQQATRAAAKGARRAAAPMRFHDALGSVVNRMKSKGTVRNNPLAMFEQQQAARKAAREATRGAPNRARFAEAVDAVRQRNNKTDLVARFNQQQAARMAAKGRIY